MIGYDLDRGGPKDSENAPNSFLTKRNGKGFWQFATDMLWEVIDLYLFPAPNYTKQEAMDSCACPEKSKTNN